MKIDVLLLQRLGASIGERVEFYNKSPDGLEIPWCADPDIKIVARVARHMPFLLRVLHVTDLLSPEGVKELADAGIDRGLGFSSVLDFNPDTLRDVKIVTSILSNPKNIRPEYRLGSS